MLHVFQLLAPLVPQVVSKQSLSRGPLLATKWKTRERMLLTCSGSSDLITTVSGVTQGILGMAGDSTLCTKTIGKSETILPSGPPSSMGGLSETPLYPTITTQTAPSPQPGPAPHPPICTCNTTQPPPLTSFLPSPQSHSLEPHCPSQPHRRAHLLQGSSLLSSAQFLASEPLLIERSLWPPHLILHRYMTSGCVLILPNKSVVSLWPGAKSCTSF